MAKNFKNDEQAGDSLRSSKHLVFTKDVVMVGSGTLLGVQEFVEKSAVYSYSAIVTSDSARVYELSIKVC